LDVLLLTVQEIKEGYFKSIVIPIPATNKQLSKATTLTIFSIYFAEL
jgi:hypothetical protein